MKSAIVGCGGIAAVHAHCVSSMEGHEFVGFADCKPERAKQFAAQYGGRAYESLEEMLEQEEIDVLHICTPHYLHVPMSVMALKKGIHVYQEKPSSISKEQYQELCDAVKESNARFGISYQNRYNPSVLKAWEILHSGEAGKILGGRGLVTWSRDEAYYTESGWRGSWKTEGGGCLINQTGHTMDLVTSFLGTPDSVDAIMTNHHLKGIIEVEDTMEAYIHCSNEDGGCYATFYGTNDFCSSRPPLIEVVCENLTLRIEELELTIYYEDGRVERPELPAREAHGKSYWGAGHQDAIADFYDCIMTGRRFVLDLEGTDSSNRLILAAYESATEQKTVNL